MEFTYLFYILGAVLRAVVPYLNKWLQEGGAFDYRYLAGQVIGVATVLLAAAQYNAAEHLANVGTLGYFGALVAGWFAGDVGNELIHKTGLSKRIPR